MQIFLRQTCPVDDHISKAKSSKPAFLGYLGHLGYYHGIKGVQQVMRELGLDSIYFP